MSGNPKTATAAGDDDNVNFISGTNQNISFDGSGELKINIGDLQIGGVGGNGGTLTTSGTISGGGGGGAGGCGGAIGWTTTGSPGGVFVHDRVPELERQVEELKTKLAELEKAENDRKDVEYFQRNMKKALRIPEHVKLGWEMPKVEVGPDDVLVVYLNVADVPASRVETFMRRAKEGLGSLFEERGLKGRNVWVATRKRETGFGVIGIKDGPAMKKLMEEAVDYANATRSFTPAKKRYPPPVMG